MNKRYLHFDFPAVKIGAATYEDDPTGCTVFHFPERVAAAVDVRGGDPGVSEYQYSHYDAICFAGGSLRGLEAASGVRAELVARHGPDCDLVSGAVVNDSFQRANERYPDKALGQLAFRQAESNRFPLGAQGAGRNVWVGGRRGRAVGRPEQAGQGGAFRQIGPVKLAAFTVLNAFGALHHRQGHVVRGNLDPETGRRIPYLDGLPALLDGGTSPLPSGGNTTLTLVLTNQALSAGALRQVGRQVHSAMARAIQPFHTLYDGDVLYAATTNQVEDSRLDPVSLGLVAAEVVWDALLVSSD